ncbi:GNAT family N-acetyltransferase [Arthrobacter sp. UYEF3]|uniref:GNAT family N-acetyltransferase n=1 Tax=Arthrobacter sp. UYEF3 TaxID=1756365 RepID=UPI00339198B7
MSPSAEPVPVVALLDVTDAVLERLLSLALHDADADEVTPPLGTAEGWNTERISWFRAYHHAAAAGLDGPGRQKTWAVTADGEPAGSVRLRRVPDGGTGPSAHRGVALETGIWLGRSFRGRGIGREALRLVTAQASIAGARLLEAETTAGNSPAQALLRSAGAELAAGGQQVKARLNLS